MADPADLTDPAQFAWLVQRRSENQRLLFDLYSFGVAKKDVLPGDLETCAAFHFLVGAAFSLWRAVFLAAKETTDQERFNHSLKFLERLVADNAITYTQDQNLRSWSGGYYLNNAYYRLNEAVAALRPHLVRLESPA